MHVLKVWRVTWLQMLLCTMPCKTLTHCLLLYDAVHPKWCACCRDGTANRQKLKHKSNSTSCNTAAEQAADTRTTCVPGKCSQRQSLPSNHSTVACEQEEFRQELQSEISTEQPHGERVVCANLQFNSQQCQSNSAAMNAQEANSQHQQSRDAVSPGMAHAQRGSSKRQRELVQSDARSKASKKLQLTKQTWSLHSYAIYSTFECELSTTFTLNQLHLKTLIHLHYGEVVVLTKSLVQAARSAM